MCPRTCEGLALSWAMPWPTYVAFEVWVGHWTYVRHSAVSGLAALRQCTLLYTIVHYSILFYIILYYNTLIL